MLTAWQIGPLLAGYPQYVSMTGWILCDFIMDSWDLFTYVLQGSFTGTTGIIWLPRFHMSVNKVDRKYIWVKIV